MRFLLDENVDLRLRPFLASIGHDVAAVATDYQTSLPDQAVLALAYQEGRILITNDRDFGDLIVRERQPHMGVIFFRLTTTAVTVKRDRLSDVLRDYPDWLDRFLVVTERTVRVR